jgi:hypothetical protein
VKENPRAVRLALPGNVRHHRRVVHPGLLHPGRDSLCRLNPAGARCCPTGELEEAEGPEPAKRSVWSIAADTLGLAVAVPFIQRQVN